MSQSKPDTPCSRCGTLLFTSRLSLPADRRKCLRCRREEPAVPKPRAPRRLSLPPRMCERCSGVYSPCRRGQRWCSPRCKDGSRVTRSGGAARLSPEAQERRRLYWQEKGRRRRAVKRGSTSEPYTLAEIAERDSERCGLCGSAVPMDVRVPNPLAPTIDHVIPISRGGGDTRTNVQLAHFRCNSVKGAREIDRIVPAG
ncbi:HNH endonuclease [Streptomyces sp. NRRL F-2664]|uniref:HNH endonuclease n=1 Tax=Streptomyces sp. NRRL F-2664 TaxID=1463842 RepID=UPI000997D9A7